MSQAGALNANGSGGNFNLQKVAVQTGTSPVVPNSANQITFNGAVVAAGTHPVRTDGTGANTMALEVQTAQAIASTDATKIGLASFNSADFTVDANGFVSTTGSSGISTIDGNTGSVTGSTVSIVTPASTGTLNFSGTGTALTLNLMDGSGDLSIGNSVVATGGNSVVLGTSANDGGHSGSVVIGQGAQSNSSGSRSVAIGYFSTASAGDNVAIGSSSIAAGFGVAVGTSANGAGVAIGRQAITFYPTAVAVGSYASNSGPAATSLGYNSTSTGSNNCTCIGSSCNDLGGTFTTLLGASSNGGSAGYTMALGINSGSSNTTGGSNVYINNVGVSAESNVIRIGTQGTGNGQQNACYIAGIYNNNSSGFTSPLAVYVDSSTGQLGYGSSGGSGITTIDGDTGSVTGSTISFNGLTNAGSTVSFSGSGTTMSFKTSDSLVNTLIGVGAGNASITGSYNTGLGQICLNGLTSGGGNVAVGNSALAVLTTGAANTAVGRLSLSTLTTGFSNVAIGLNSMAGTSTGSQNVAVGHTSLTSLGTGTKNIAIGYIAGNLYSGSESSNILIGHNGVAGESNVTRIGYISTAQSTQTSCFIDGIQRATYNAAHPLPALTYCDNSAGANAGQLVATLAVASSTATSTFGSLVVGTALQNTSNYAILVNVSMAITSATAATIVMGVGSTNTPTTNTIVASFSVAETVSFSAFVPAGYYMLVNTTGTIVVGSITTQTCAVG